MLRTIRKRQLENRERIVRSVGFARIFVAIFAMMLLASVYFMIGYDVHVRAKTVRTTFLTPTKTSVPSATAKQKPAVTTSKERVVPDPSSSSPTCIHSPISAQNLRDKNAVSSRKSRCVFSHDTADKNSQTTKFDFSTARCKITDLHEVAQNSRRDIVQGKSEQYAPGVFTMSTIGHSTFTSSDFVLVSCKTSRNDIYLDVHAEITPKIADKFDNPDPQIGEKDRHKYNVIIVALSSISRKDFIQNFRRSYKYFSDELGGIVLEGYSNLDVSASYTLLHLLTGQVRSELSRSHQRGLRVNADNFPWVWQKYKRQGYVTQIALDVVNVSTFTFSQNGFTSKPTDHDMSAYYLAKSRWKLTYPPCERSKGDITLDWIRQLFTVYRQRPKFSFTLLSDCFDDPEFKHENLDSKLEVTLAWFRAHKHDRDTILVLTTQPSAFDADIEYARLGDELPFFGIYLPTTFQNWHRLELQNLLINRHRLTTPLDVYSTLSTLVNKPIRSTMADISRRSVSLFSEIPPERTCAHAKIHPDICPCMAHKPISLDSSFAKGATQRAIKFLNTIIGPYDRDCAKLNLHNITRVTRYETILKTIHINHQNNTQSITIVPPQTEDTLVSLRFTTLPGNSSFELLSIYKKSKKKIFFDNNNIIRLNSYGNDSHCILSKHFHLRHLCYCI